MVMAVVLLMAFAFVFLLYSRGGVNLEFTSPSIQSYLDGCLKQTAEDGLELLGKQGGRIWLQDYVSAPHYGITYWLKDDTLSIPTTQTMESELSGYINNNLERCINDFEEFEDRGWDVAAGDISTSVSINQDEVSIVALYPLTVTQQENILTITQFTARLPVRLRHIHSTASGAAQFMHANGKIDLTMLDSSELNTTVFPYKNALIYHFSDEQSKLKNGPFVFNVALS